MGSVDRYLDEKLAQRSANNAYRQLQPGVGLIDFCSNDYLGFIHTGALEEKIRSSSSQQPLRSGSSGSRLLSGDSQLAHDIEKMVADYHKAPAALLFNSGYDANIGLFSCIAERNDTILYDELCHASIRDGVRLSLASSFKFRHNDISHLEQLIKKSQGRVFVAVESVYSMDGDLAPLSDIVSICKKQNAALIVDEAHATGLYGSRGEGKVVDLELQDAIFARVHTFGKALGCHGAAVIGSRTLKDYLINYARSFIYTTALPDHSLLAIQLAYQLLEQSEASRLKAHHLTRYFQSEAVTAKIPLLDSESPVQGVVIPGNEKIKKVAGVLQDQGFDIRPILSPTVAKGKERLRICIHAFNTEEEIDAVVKCIMANYEMG